MNFKRDTSQKRCSRNKEFLGHNVQFFKRFQRVLYQAVMVDLTVAQKCHGNFNFLTAISTCSRQFHFAHGNFNFLTANNAHGVFFLNFGGRQRPPKVKTQNQKSIFKVDLQSEKWKSKIESRFTNTYVSRQCVDKTRVYWSQNIISFIWHSPGGLFNIYCTASQNGPIPHIKVAEHSFGSLWVYVICQIMARERLQLTSWNLASEKYTDERFWLTGKIWRFRSFHGNMNNWIQL